MISYSAEKIMDPVCGMEIDPATSATHTEYRGLTYHFCHEECRREFERRPRVYVRHPGEPPNWFQRWLCRMARANTGAFGAGGPRCH